jgi:hypothetical protein
VIVIVPPPELLELEELELLLDELLELEELELLLDELLELEELELLLDELLELEELELLLEDELLALLVATMAPGSVITPLATPSASPVPPSVRGTETELPLITTPGSAEHVPLLHFSKAVAV